MQNKITEICEDYYRLTSAALEKKSSLETELKIAEKKRMYESFRKIAQQLKANEEYRTKLSETLYEKLEEIFSAPSCAE